MCVKKIRESVRTAEKLNGLKNLKPALNIYFVPNFKTM